VYDFFTALPTLETPHLLLRAVRLDDATDQWIFTRDPIVAELGMWQPLPTLQENIQDVADTLARYAAGQPTEWGIQHRADHRLIGRCGFVRYRPEHHNAEVGYALARAYWRQGLMTEALDAVVACGFRMLSLHRIEATCLADNAGSIRLLEKAGFQREGTAREAYHHQGIYKDVHRYALLRR